MTTAHRTIHHTVALELSERVAQLLVAEIDGLTRIPATLRAFQHELRAALTDTKAKQ